MTAPAQQQAMRAPQSIGVRSPAFEHGKPIPREFSGFGEDVSPEIEITGVPSGAQALAIVVDDPDAPRGTFTHWTVWDLPADTRRLERGAGVGRLGGAQGRNGFGFAKYMGPKPPSGTHRYFFRVFALSKRLGLPPNAPVEDVWKALAGNVVAWGETMGTFTRP